MKIFEKLKNKHSEMFLALGTIYLIGALADGFGFFNWVVNMMGIIMQIAALVFIVVNFVILFDSGLLPARKSVIINVIVIFLSLVLIVICWKLKMTAFIVTSFVIMLINFLMLIFSVYRLTRVYIEIINEEKRKNNINTPKGSIIELLKYFG